jgi:hypothetical protein
MVGAYDIRTVQCISPRKAKAAHWESLATRSAGGGDLQRGARCHGLRGSGQWCHEEGGKRRVCRGGSRTIRGNVLRSFSRTEPCYFS